LLFSKAITKLKNYGFQGIELPVAKGRWGRDLLEQEKLQASGKKNWEIKNSRWIWNFIFGFSHRAS